MKTNIFLTYKLFSSIVDFAELLEEESNRLIQIFCELDTDDESDNFKISSINNLNKIHDQAGYIKKEILSAAEFQNDVLSNYEIFLNKMNVLSEELQKINAACSRLSESNYFLSPQGLIIKKRN